ncbi:barstar family protein [Pasteurella skyensis]|uniref:Barstar family protein n=1 Tax=Phocoenobacter skyensis TaxID=97481 RepID=A0AAJ6P2P2_9PAST|nr:barstar family protein [Pasteurella skyensis]MDP8170781.1 barstar family protein [Pasteurella skyensis]MDP8174900.1 barstar family protein [Pasteurella skyensis]
MVEKQQNQLGYRNMYKITLFLKYDDDDGYPIYAQRIVQEDTIILRLIGYKGDINFKTTFERCVIEVKNNQGMYSEVERCVQVDKLVADEDKMFLYLDNDFLSAGWLEYNIFEYLEILSDCTEKRYWLNLNEEEKSNWCVSCMKFNRQPELFHEEVVIDGRFIDSKLSFLCEFAESIIGIGGYFGSTLDGFEDCLAFGYYMDHPLRDTLKNITVIWKHFDTCEFEGKDVVLEILEERGVTLIAE